MCERPVRHGPRRLADWINPTGTRKVHSLVDKVYKEKNLRRAWERVKVNRGAGGIDGQTLAEFEADLEVHLQRLHNELRQDAYQPQPVKQVMIPKPGKPEEQRPLGIPVIYDRVLQQALLNRLEPIFEPEFDDANFGYRRGRSTKDALRKIWRELNAGHEWVVDADLKNFLETSSYYTPFHEGRSKSPGWLSKTLIRKPLRFPRRTCTAASSPRFTRCKTVWRETPRIRIALNMST